MRFEAMSVEGAWLIEPEPLRDERGFFARTWDRDEMAARGLATGITQCSVSHNVTAHTLRGMHYQIAPHEEAKLVSCPRGAIFDVVLDLRPGSPTYRRWAGAGIDEDDRRMTYVPPGVAHGFLTLREATDVHYQIAGAFAPEAARGVRFDDPAFGIEWPAEPRVVAERDRAYPDFDG